MRGKLASLRSDLFLLVIQWKLLDDLLGCFQYHSSSFHTSLFTHRCIRKGWKILSSFLYILLQSHVASSFLHFFQPDQIFEGLTDSPQLPTLLTLSVDYSHAYKTNIDSTCTFQCLPSMLPHTETCPFWLVLKVYSNLVPSSSPISISIPKAKQPINQTGRGALLLYNIW